MTNMTLRVAIIILVICVGRVVSSSYNSTSDLTGFGGNQGWGLGFHGPDQYASVSNYFTASQYWPKQNISGNNF